MTKEQQRRFVIGVVEQLGYDFSKGRLDDTVHPFMTALIEMMRGLLRAGKKIISQWQHLV